MGFYSFHSPGFRICRVHRRTLALSSVFYAGGSMAGAVFYEVLFSRSGEKERIFSWIPLDVITSFANKSLDEIPFVCHQQEKNHIKTRSKPHTKHLTNLRYFSKIDYWRDAGLMGICFSLEIRLCSAVTSMVLLNLYTKYQYNTKN